MSYDDYFGESYWADSYWSDSYWAEYGAPAPVAPTPPESITTTVRTRPYKIKKHHKDLFEDPQFVSALIEFLENT